MNMLVELFPEENCATVIALYNFILMPFNMVIGPLAGWSIDKTGSYLPVFKVSAAMCVISALGFLFLVHEPRKQLKPEAAKQE
jgi:MFS family permease